MITTDFFLSPAISSSCDVIIDFDQINHLFIKNKAYVHLLKSLMSCCFNPLTTDNKCTRHATLAARCQLAQSVLKIGFALS